MGHQETVSFETGLACIGIFSTEDRHRRRTDDALQVLDVRPDGDVVLLVSVLNLLEKPPDYFLALVQLGFKYVP